MKTILKEIDKVRHKLKSGIASTLLMQKPFAEGMYRFSMFMIDYYARVRENLKLDYDSFIIIQTVVSHTLYHLNQKKKLGMGYTDLEREWGKVIYSKDQSLLEAISSNPQIDKSFKLSISSICLVTKLPKETVRRKVNELHEAGLLKVSRKDGINLGTNYKKVFQNFVPTTTIEVSKLMKAWEKSGVLKDLLSFKL